MRNLIQALEKNSSTLKHLEISLARCRVDFLGEKPSEDAYVLENLSYLRVDIEESRLSPGFVDWVNRLSTEAEKTPNLKTLVLNCSSAQIDGSG